MKTIMLDVDYTGNNLFWSESSVNNKIFTIDENKNIHNQIAKILLDNDFCTLSYKNKPNSNIFIDKKDGSIEAVGYVYRGKQEIPTYDGSKAANFDVWVTIKEISNFKIDNIECSQ